MKTFSGPSCRTCSRIDLKFRTTNFSSVLMRRLHGTSDSRSFHEAWPRPHSGAEGDSDFRVRRPHARIAVRDGDSLTNVAKNHAPSTRSTTAPPARASDGTRPVA